MADAGDLKTRRIRNLIAICFMASAAVRATPDDGPAAPPANPPLKPTGLTERIEKRLVQLDVGVEGDPDAIRSITAKDFALYVGEHEISGLIVDHLCGNEQPSTVPTKNDNAAESPLPTVALATPRARPSFVFYFDQSHLTMAGRDLSLETCRGLINHLLSSGARASIVSSGQRLETIVQSTGDREKLLAGLDRLRSDPRHLETYAMAEATRVDYLAWECTRNPPGCLPLAKWYANEERLEAKRSTERLGIVLGSLAEVSMPKALVYFGDTLRQKAGLHYLYMAPEATRLVATGELAPDSAQVVATGEMVPSAAFEVDAVINEALARGVHFFTIQAEGITATLASSKDRNRQAQDTLVGLAAETGGEAFLGGASRDYIGSRIAARTSCALLLSFPPGDLPRDKPLNVTLELKVPKVKIRTQGRIVVPSPASIERARLLSAFADPASSDDGSLRVLLIPRGGDGKIWNASVQVRLRPSGRQDNSFDMGASIVRHDTVPHQFSASIATTSGTRAMVLEKSLEMAPGEFSVVAVAKDVRNGEVVSSRLDGAWPNLANSEAAIASIAVLQSAAAAISKDGILQSSGSLARDVDEMLDAAASVTLETVVCRGAKTTAPVVVERWLEDGLAKEFAPMTIAESDAPCLQTVDAVPPGRLRPGVVDYRVVARIGDEIVAQGRRTLRVAASGEKR